MHQSKGKPENFEKDCEISRYLASTLFLPFIFFKIKSHFGLIGIDFYYSNIELINVVEEQAHRILFSPNRTTRRMELADSNLKVSQDSLRKISEYKVTGKPSLLATTISDFIEFLWYKYFGNLFE